MKVNANIHGVLLFRDMLQETFKIYFVLGVQPYQVARLLCNVRKVCGGPTVRRRPRPSSKHGRTSTSRSSSALLILAESHSSGRANMLF